jgi:hypothetical protein
VSRGKEGGRRQLQVKGGHLGGPEAGGCDLRRTGVAGWGTVRTQRLTVWSLTMQNLVPIFKTLEILFIE